MSLVNSRRNLKSCSWMLPLIAANIPLFVAAGEQPCNRSFSIIVILITSQTSCATKITAQLSSHRVRLHADAHENNGQRKFQTVPAESEKSAASDTDLLPTPTWWHRMQSTKKRVIDISGVVRMHQLDGKEHDKRVSSCIEMLANIYEYYTMAWLDFFCLSMVVPHTLSRNPCLTCRTTSSWSWRQIGEMYRNV